MTPSISRRSLLKGLTASLLAAQFSTPASAASPDDLISTLLKKNQGIAFGEDHQSSEIYNFIGKNALQFKKQGIKSVYLEAIESKDQAKVEGLLKTGDKDGMLAYFQTRTWSPQLAHDYTDMAMRLQNSGIEVVGIDLKTDDRFITGSNHWLDVIKERNKNLEPDDKYLVVGGSSHFGNVFGPGVNVKLGIPTVDFHIEANAQVAADVNKTTFQGRKAGDFTITLPTGWGTTPTQQKAPEKAMRGTKPSAPALR